MRRIGIRLLVLAVACSAVLSADREILLRVERRSVDDLKTLRTAQLPVVMELSSCLLVRGSARSLAWLEANGYGAEVLDPDAAGAEYLIVGLRLDSNRETVMAHGKVLLRDENWLLLREAPNAERSVLREARIHVTVVPREPLAPPRDTPSLTRSEKSERAPDPIVQKMVGAVSPTEIGRAWQDLTSNPPTGTRYTYSQGCRDAADYCHDRLASWGVPAEYQDWSPSHAPNVIGTLEGALHPEDVFIVIGHLDDLPASGPAPGADDNASGSVNVLEAARVMSCWAQRSTVKFIACTGEELGLLGSSAYASDAADRDENILGVLNMDMIGWEGDGAPNPENLDLNYNAASEDLALVFADAAGTYGTGLVVDAFLCPSLSVSDHYPFWTRGWKAVCGITDNEGYCGHSGYYPYYHTSNDTIANNGDPAFFHSVVRTTVATLGELARPFKIALGRDVYGCGGVAVEIVLGDRDLDTNPSAVETVTVLVRSDTETTPEEVVLTERAAHSMIFSGTIPTTTSSPVGGDGLLSVVPGDSIFAGYTDDLDCDGASGVLYEAEAQTDCEAPSISGVEAGNVTGNSAVISWTTTEPATSVVHYGTTPPGSATATGATLETTHSVLLTGLSECSTYYFWVASEDEAGNAASDDNGGAFYTFETGKNVNPAYPYTGPAVPIPDSDPTGASVVVTVPDANTVLDVDVRVDVEHSYDGDLTLSLVGPDGTEVVLSNRRGGSGNDFIATVFDDEAATAVASGVAPFTGSFRPDEPLAAFDGRDPTGTWTLEVVDAAGSDTGTIDGFELRLSFPPQACGPSVEYASATAADTCDGPGPGDDNGTIEPGETVVLTVTARNNGTDPVTGVSATVTTSTPGAFVLDAHATFPDLPPGGVGESLANPVSFLLNPDFPCGDTADFSIVFTTNEGSWADSFSLPTGTPGQSTNTWVSIDVPKPIPDSGTVSSTIVVPETGIVQDVNVTLSITHTYDGDLDIFLVDPNGTRVELSSDNGGTGENFANTVFDDEALASITTGSAPFSGSYRPEGSLSALNGVPAHGTWSLEITDDAGGDTGTLTAWSLEIRTVGTPQCDVCVTGAIPGEVSSLTWESGGNMLVWTAAPLADSYRLCRGVGADLPKLMDDSIDSCTRMTTADLDSGPELTESLPPGTLHWFLVRAQNAAGLGPAGAATAGPRMQDSAGDCP